MSICSICVCILTHKCTQREGEGEREEEPGRGEIEREKREKGERLLCPGVYLRHDSVYPL